MPVTKPKNPEIKVVGKSWVIDLPDDFSCENNLEKGTQVLLTFKEGEKVEAEILPPLSDRVAEASANVLRRRRGAYEDLKRRGD